MTPVFSRQCFAKRVPALAIAQPALAVAALALAIAQPALAVAALALESAGPSLAIARPVLATAQPALAIARSVLSGAPQRMDLLDPACFLPLQLLPGMLVANEARKVMQPVDGCRGDGTALRSPFFLEAT